MPRKFSCRQLRETGQCFESFLEVRGLDMETDREQLRSIYNRDFKPRYGPAHSPTQNCGPSSPPRPPRPGRPSRPRERRDAAPAAVLAGLGAAQSSPPARCPRPARAARGPPALPPPGPCAEPPRKASPQPRPGRPGPGSGSCGRPPLEGGSGDCAAHGGGECRVGASGVARAREGASCWWRRVQARGARVPPPPC